MVGMPRAPLSQHKRSHKSREQLPSARIAPKHRQLFSLISPYPASGVSPSAAVRAWEDLSPLVRDKLGVTHQCRCSAGTACGTSRPEVLQPLSGGVKHTQA